MSRRDLRAEALADFRAGRGAGAEALLEAALVALPFSGFLGIFVNAATGWPTPRTGIGCGRSASGARPWRRSPTSAPAHTAPPSSSVSN